MAKRRIKSRTDVITNSSSEVFVFRNYGKSVDDILQDLESIDSKKCSGMGGELSVYDNTSPKNKEWDESYEWIPDGWSMLDIDEAKDDVIDYLLKNYYVIDSDYFYIKDDQGRLLRRPSKEEWEWIKNLKPEERQTYDIISFMEDWPMMTELREELKDEKAFLEKIKKRWKSEKKKKKKEYSSYGWLQSTFKTPEGELEFRKKRCKEFFEKHPVSPAELYKYDMTKPLD